MDTTACSSAPGFHLVIEMSRIIQVDSSYKISVYRFIRVIEVVRFFS